ncbi:uncharacterized protein LOC129894771 [Solanum dulcamara]|uniref:uncharacterized protein LOC129894771 n=1 Tax=Solanum dulcamara TaxID=45834 RepID=UPI002484F619|nr:uncharacterized protein LOC129894771 [Solanum dulcamara]
MAMVWSVILEDVVAKFTVVASTTAVAGKANVVADSLRRKAESMGSLAHLQLSLSIDIAPFEALYRRRFRSPISWFDAFKVRPWGTGVLRESLEKVKFIQEKLLASQSKKKEYADRKVRDIKFMEGEKMLLKVSPMKGVVRFGKRGKLSPNYIRPFEILKRVREVAYKLDIPPGLSGVHPVFHVSMLKKYNGAGDYIIRWNSVLLDENFSYEEEPVTILDREVLKLRSREITSMKVQWKNRLVEESTWETKADMRGRYPHLFVELGNLL